MSAKRLREQMTGGTVVAPFVHDGLLARLAQQVGFEAVYMTGFGTAARLGLPDVGIITFTEMLENARTITAAVDIPVICDADTGYGNPVNVVRTVREYERAGVAACHIEDQQWPKRCGYMQGKAVITAEEMVQKLRAALDTRRGDMLIIARTDALQPEGWEGAEQRARRYMEEGVDAVFVDGVGGGDVDEYATRLGDLPLLFNNGPLLPLGDLQAHRFALVIHPGTLAAVLLAAHDALVELKERGSISTARSPEAFALALRALDAARYFEIAERYA